MNIRPFSKSYDGRLVLDFPGIVLHPGEVTAGHWRQWAVANPRLRSDRGSNSP